MRTIHNTYFCKHYPPLPQKFSASPPGVSPSTHDASLSSSQIQLQSTFFSPFSLFLEIVFTRITESLLPCGSRGSRAGGGEAAGGGGRTGGDTRGKGCPFHQWCSFRARLVTANLVSDHPAGQLLSPHIPAPLHSIHAGLLVQLLLLAHANLYPGCYLG